VALFLQFDWPENGPDGPAANGKGAWLAALGRVAPISDADGKDDRAAALAFTWTGLQKMGLPLEALITFSAPFREGMYQEDRLRRLGDYNKDAWQDPVIAGGPRWSANTPAREFFDPRAAAGLGYQEPKEFQVATPLTVHALLMLYDVDDQAAAAWATQTAAALAPFSIKVVHTLPLDLRHVGGVAQEHFGFADGLSQPIPFEVKDAPQDPDALKNSGGNPVTRDPLHGVPLGEILIGHVNAHHERAPGPVVRECNKAIAACLSTCGAPDGFRNLGFNGSYMVVRELRQDVAAFWNAFESNAVRICNHDPSAVGTVTADWLAERVVGRTIGGHVLLPPDSPLPAAGSPPNNDFRFLKDDPHGYGCPIGSHVRRANPRDGLAKDEASAQTLLDAANNHRILRRGRKYGPTIEDRMKDDGADRGLLFVCLNTDIARQFEFVQQTWLLNQNFGTLFDESDPLVGPKGPFTIPNDPLRRRVEVETFIEMAGGEYFFLPSLPALTYLEQL
jgi:Dyp-type peroxidase family